MVGQNNLSDSVAHWLKPGFGDSVCDFGHVTGCVTLGSLISDSCLLGCEMEASR